MTTETHLTDLQLAIVRILWQRGECSVLEVQDALLPERRLALTTVATLLSRLEKRGVVAHRAEGRVYVYRATVTEPQVRRTMVAELTELLFDGRPAALISHLLSSRDIRAGDLAEVKRLIAEAEARGDATSTR
jgi:predicted transcriptional regulator